MTNVKTIRLTQFAYRADRVEERCVQHFKTREPGMLDDCPGTRQAVVGSRLLRKLSGLQGKSWPGWRRWDVMFVLACGGGFKHGLERWRWNVVACF